MPQIINTNIASLTAQRNLNTSQQDSNVAFQRLSSGLRINSAKDDAAGLAISTRFQSQITGLNMAQRNANDGISLAQTAEGALDEVTNNLQRIRELSVQSANATNSTSDQQALNQEVQERIAEINRVASQTSFNGLKVLDGTFGEQTFQVGANAGETIGVNGLDSRGSKIGSIVTQTTGLAATVVSDPVTGVTATNETGLTYNGPDISGTVTINGVELTVDTQAYADATALAANIGAQIIGLSGADADAVADIVVGADADTLTFTSSRGSVVDAVIDLNSEEVAAIELTGTGSAVENSGAPVTVGDISSFAFSNAASGEITVGGEAVTFDFSMVTDQASFLSAVNEQIVDQTSLTAGQLVAGVSGNDLILTNTTAAAIAISDTSISDNGIPAVDFDQTLKIAGQTGTTLADTFDAGTPVDFSIALSGLDDVTFDIAGATSLNDMISQINAKTVDTGIRANLNSANDEIIFSSQYGDEYTVSITSTSLVDAGGLPLVNHSLEATAADDTVSVNDLDISTRKGAELALVAVDYAFDKINSFRAELGAIQNRFESTIANLSTTSENLSAANSRIRDADFAAETAELSRTQVLQQAGMSILSQANAQPQQVLQLLQG